VTGARVVIDRPQWQVFRQALVAGVVNIVGAIDGEAKALTPVYGDPNRGGEFKSRAPGAKPLGGTLARSIHHVVYLDGHRLFGGGSDENGESLPSYSTRRGIEGFVGTNVYYAVFVHDGTVKMVERPFLATARRNVEPQIVALFAAGFQRAWR